MAVKTISLHKALRKMGVEPKAQACVDRVAPHSTNKTHSQTPSSQDAFILDNSKPTCLLDRSSLVSSGLGRRKSSRPFFTNLLKHLIAISVITVSACSWNIIAVVVEPVLLDTVPVKFFATSSIALAQSTSDMDIQPQPAEELILGPPAFVPTAITVAKPTPVRFAAVASGVTKYPSALELQEFDPQNDRWKKVTDGQLRDDGRNGDLVAGDRIYARRLTVEGTRAGEKRYRVMFSQSDKPIVSNPHALQMTRFPVDAAQGDFAVIEDKKTGRKFAAGQGDFVVIEDKKTGRKFVAEQVTARFLPGVSEERIQAIVESATRRATGQAGHIIGYLSQIRVVQVALAEDPDASEETRVAAVKTAVAALERYDEVRHAQPNFVFKFAQMPEITPDGENGVICKDTTQQQWAAYKIKAPEAWYLVGTLSRKKRVAVVDTGVAPSSNPSGDLCWGESTAAGSRRIPAGCDPVNVLGDEHVPATDQLTGQDYAEHGTRVAGIIAAQHGNADGSGNPIGISGIAHGLPILSFDVGTSLFHDGFTRKDKILNAAGTPEVGIINISVGDDNQDLDFLCALQRATCHTAAPPECRCGDTDHARLVVAAAGNLGLATDPPYDTYPCKWTETEALDSVLCVANTDREDKLNSLSNYGTWVDLTAPGTQVCTTSVSGYVAPSATSFAVPHVAGAAAVLWSMKPVWTAVQVANRLKETADPIDNKNLSKYRGKLGSGRLNLLSAVSFNVVGPSLNTPGNFKMLEQP